MKKSIKLLFLAGIIFLATFSCEENDNISIYTTEGFLIGFDPCTINHQYRIGYVIISKNFKDTLITYNISDSIYKMPANIIFNSDTLYTIPTAYFQNYRFSAYFPEIAQSQFIVKVEYIKTPEKKIVINVCSDDINQNDFYKNWIRNQVIIKNARTF